jgi:hypothetical protein
MIDKIFLIIFSFFLGLTLSSLAWINPDQNPPFGGGILQTDSQGLKIITTTRIMSGNLLINTGNLGIGVLPTEKLTISGNIALNQGSNSFIGTFDNYALSLRTNNIDRIFISNDGNIGMLSTTIVKNILPETNNTYTLGNSTNQFANIYTNTTTISGNIIIGSNSFYNLNSTTTFFTGTNNNQLVLGLNGNIGIGTTSLSSKLNIAGDIDVMGNKIINVATPTNPTDVANKAYVDSIGASSIPSGTWCGLCGDASTNVKTCLGYNVCTGCPPGWTRVLLSNYLWGSTTGNDYICVKD